MAKKNSLILVCLLALLPALLLGLPGCSIFSAPPALPLVTLRARLPELPLCEAPIALQIAVPTPDATDSLHTDRIALLFDEREIKYLAGVKWEAAAPAMLRRHMASYLEATNCFSGVGGFGEGLSSRYRLQSELQRFFFCYTGRDSPPTAQIVLRLRLVDTESGAILASKSVNFQEKARGQDTGALLDAMDSAVHQAMLDMSRWVVSSLREARY